MSAENNTTEYCNVTKDAYDKWTEAYQNQTSELQLKTLENGNSSTVDQNCKATGNYYRTDAPKCPSTIYTDCQLLKETAYNTTYPFSKGTNTSEVCECMGTLPNSTSSPVTMNCTCMNDWKKGTPLYNHTNYLFSKNCNVSVQQDANNTYDMNCTFKNCLFNAQAQLFNITLESSKNCNDTSTVNLIANITDSTTKTTSVPTPLSSPASSNTSTSQIPTNTTQPLLSANASNTSDVTALISGSLQSQSAKGSAAQQALQISSNGYATINSAEFSLSLTLPLLLVILHLLRNCISPAKNNSYNQKKRKHKN